MKSWPASIFRSTGRDTSIRWPSGTERTRKLDYLVGPEEWRRLVRALHLG
jgi:hypothetical protein